MFRRDGPGEGGAFMRAVMEPMAEALGVEHDLSLFLTPQTDEQVALEVLRCGYDLLVALTYADGWATGDPGMASPRQGRQAARRMRANLPSATGRAGVAHMARRYGESMAAMWRRAAQESDPAEASRLLVSAQASEDLACLASSAWPIDDLFDALPRVAAATTGRLCDPNTPASQIDLRAAADRADSMAEAVALAFGEQFREFEPLILAPVRALQPVAALGVLADWDLTARYWTNLMADEPLPRDQVLELIIEERATRSGEEIMWRGRRA